MNLKLLFMWPVPPHEIIGKSRIPNKKKHGQNMAYTTIRKDPMLLGPYTMINNPVLM
jgi:hypothetical protein